MSGTVKRTISGICFVGIMLAGLLVSKYTFAALFIFIMVGMMSEFYRMTMGEKYVYSRAFAILSSVVLFVLIFCTKAFGMRGQWCAMALLPIILVMIFSLYSKDKTEFGKFSNLYTGILYIAIPVSLANFVAFIDGHYSGIMLLCFFIIIWASDVGAFCFGTLFGKYTRKLFPAISPNKSWAGFWGGMALSVVAAIILELTGMLQLPLLHAALMGALMHIAGVYGDLFESQWKRTYDLKDSGNIIPGHGGLLDRFDSTLFAIPAGVLYLLALNLL